MTTLQTALPALRKPLRLWPGVALATLQVVAWFGLPIVMPENAFFGVFGATVGGLGIVLWWLLFSRAAWSERLGGLVLMAGGIYATTFLLHLSVARVGMGFMYFIYAIALVPFCFAVAVAIGRNLAPAPRRAVALLAVLVACGWWPLVRNEGLTGGGQVQFKWRWSPTPEQQLLAQARTEPVPSPTAAPASVAPPAEAPKEKSAPAAEAKPAARAAASEAAVAPVPEWPGFRGRNRDGVVRGTRIQTDWTAAPPVELWRRAVGPGWSSLAVGGELLHTQEQRGEDEVVVCYNLKTGEPVWEHRSPARFWQAQGGAGPRATPTLHNGRVYALGATGILNALDAATGAEVWSRNAGTDAEVKVPFEGFASSPLVVQDIVVVAAAGRLVAYDLATGERRWLGPKGGRGYSSPHLVTIDGVPQILLMSGNGALSVSPTDGKPLWERAWPGGDRIVQPALASASDLLMTTGGEAGMGEGGLVRIAVAHGANGWTVEDRWTSRGLKPNFNDYVVHKGHAYGFDGRILSCIDLTDGSRKWKGGRYGNGQLILLADQDLLLVLSEEGELALVAASPDGYQELSRVPVIEGKTWNHPVLVGAILLVRNDREMAAFRLPAAKQPGN
ncbi:MAG: PQQ-binding-like beta-propeller repeat protein [Candidatus Acidiferrales bacterium]